MGSMPVSQEEGTLLVSGIEEKARWFANDTAIRYPSADWEKDGYLSLSWSHWAETINKVAYWLDENLGPLEDSDTVAYLGPNDLRYSILLPAMIKTGRKTLIPDGRLTDEGLTKLLDEAKCKIWMYAEDDKAGLPKAVPASIKRVALPSLDWCLDASGHKRYPYDKTWDQGKHDVVLMIHTSGTTGLPKAIYVVNGFLVSGYTHAISKTQWPRGITLDICVGRTMLSSCPPQWLGGLYTNIILPITTDTTAIIPPTNSTAYTPAIFKKLVEHNRIDGIFSPPHTIIQLYNDPSTQPLLKALSYIVYIGAAMDQKIGDDLVTHTRLTTTIGSTENGPQYILNPADKMLWHTHAFVPENGHRMERVPGSGAAADGSQDLYEMVLERQHDSPNLRQIAFWNPKYKGVNRIETNELYTPVTDLDGRTRWIFSARKDDLTKLNWLAKFRAQEIEKQILEHACVASVFVGGEGRPTPYVIVEPRPGAVAQDEAEEMLEEIYGTVVAAANRKDIEEIGIPRETVFWTRADRPFKRTGKNTLMRREIEKDYVGEIEGAYERLAKARARP